MKRYDKALTWGELATIYDERKGGGRPARTLPMVTVFDWAKEQPDITLRDDNCLYWKKKKKLKITEDDLETIIELRDLMDAVREGEYVPDSLTNQPINGLIKRLQSSKG